MRNTPCALRNPPSHSRCVLTSSPRSNQTTAPIASSPQKATPLPHSPSKHSIAKRSNFMHPDATKFFARSNPGKLLYEVTKNKNLLSDAY